MKELRNAYKILITKRDRKRPLERQRRSSEDNIKIDLRETRMKGIEWTHLARDRVER
jgi:hypothetical protein